MKNRRSQREQQGEAGYMLLAVVVLVALVLIALAVAAPVVARQLRRDKEIESQHRMNEYVRAIQLYYRKSKSYPTSFKMLNAASNVHYLRQQYADPLTGKADWIPIHLREQQTKTKIFGKDLSEIQGLGAAPGATAGAGTGFVNGGTSGTPNTTVSGGTALAAGFGGAQIGGSAGTPGTSGTTGSTGSSGALGDGSSIGPIIGLRPARSGTSITQPRGETTFESWEFWYDPLLERLRVLSKPLGGGGLGNTSSGISSTDASSYTGGANGTSGVNGASGASGASGTGGSTNGTGTPSTSGKSPF